MKFLGARHAITQATQIFLVSRGHDFGRPDNERDTSDFYYVSRKARLEFPKPGKSSTKSGATDTSGRILNYLQAGKVISAVDSQPELVRAWLWLAYGAFWKRSDVEKLEGALMALCPTPSDKSRDRWSRISRLALQDYRFRVLGLKPLPPGAVCALTGHSLTHFARDVEPKMQTCFEFLSRLDKTGVPAVARIVDILRDNENDVCRKCGGAMIRSTAIKSTFVPGIPDFVGRGPQYADRTSEEMRGQTMHYGGSGRQVDCYKCSACGWSVS